MLLLSHLAGLFCPIEATFTLSVGDLWSLYWLRNGTIVSKFFWYLSGCILTVVTSVHNLSHLMPLSRYQAFNPGLRPWHPHSIWLPRVIWLLTCWATYFSQFHAFFWPSYVDICKAITASNFVVLTWFSPTTSNGWHSSPSAIPIGLVMFRYGYRTVSLQSCHRHFCCLCHTLLYALLLTVHFAFCATCFFVVVSVTYWWLFCPQKLHTKDNHHRLLWFF